MPASTSRTKTSTPSRAAQSVRVGKMTGVKHSLWLEVPDLQPVVDRLAALVGNPPYLPHLTLVGTLPDELGDLRAAAARLDVPAALRFSGVGTRHEEDRFCCWTVDPTPTLDALFIELERLFPEADIERFRAWPHVSVVYGTPAARAHWPDATTAVRTYDGPLPTAAHVAALSVWSTGRSVEEWQRRETLCASVSSR